MVILLGWTAGCASLPANTQRTTSRAWQTPEQTALGQLTAARRTQASARSDSAFYLLDGVAPAFTSRLALIERAQHTLDLQYYAVHADASTEVLLRGLRAAAKRGVRVRILLDDFNLIGEDAQVLRLAFEPNVEVRLFNPLPGSRQNMLGRIMGSLHEMPRLQKRMHNKLFIADNAWGIAGGRNLGDRYFGSDETENFVDLDVLAAGRIVRDMSASFDRFWQDELAYPVQTLLSKQDLEELRKPQQPTESAPAASSRVPAAPAAPAIMPVAAPGGVLPTVTAAEAGDAKRAPMNLATVPLSWAPATLLVDKPDKVGPGDDEADAGDTVIDGLLHVMSQAQRDVLIISPYFVPGAQMMAIYEQLRQRGVRVRVLTNSLASNDAPAAHAGYTRYRRELLAMGVELYEMRSDPATAGGLQGSSGGEGKSKSGAGLTGSGPGGSKAITGSRASLHSKAVIIDGRLSIIGSMNLDLRSQHLNSEVALAIRSASLAKEATRQIEQTLSTGAYRLERSLMGYIWRAPPGASFGDSRQEPGASAKLRLLVQFIGPFAPESML